MLVTAHTAASPSAPELPAPRAYGASADDLDLDFGSVDRIALVTRVLAVCCTATGGTVGERAAAAWALPLGQRILRLLRILELTLERDDFSATLKCPEPSCAQAFEVGLGFASLAEHGSTGPSNVVNFELPGGEPLALRLPTGRDQAAWRDQPFVDEKGALSTIVRTLAVDPATVPAVLEPEQLAPLSQAMEEADPLVAFSLATTCPHCGHSAEIPVDLEAVVLSHLAQHRQGILRDVHHLAIRYGWTEADVLALPPRRRAEYQRLIAAEETGFP